MPIGSHVRHPVRIDHLAFFDVAPNRLQGFVSELATGMSSGDFHILRDRTVRDTLGRLILRVCLRTLLLADGRRTIQRDHGLKAVAKHFVLDRAEVLGDLINGTERSEPLFTDFQKPAVDPRRAFSLDKLGNPTVRPAHQGF
ncbi:hypothetical protein ASF25_07840 [Methylobacterium sp. Leaf100]|nr:hypothetical protein ASF25_07840 [Methylobacterium sp. Leaf100]